MWSENNVCPVCEQAAQEAMPKMGDNTEVICKDCGRFRITDSAKEEFRHKAISEKREILTSAKNGADQRGEPIPMITTYRY